MRLRKMKYHKCRNGGRTVKRHMNEITIRINKKIKLPLIAEFDRVFKLGAGL